MKLAGIVPPETKVKFSGDDNHLCPKVTNRPWLPRATDACGWHDIQAIHCAIGAVLFELLSGRRAHELKNYAPAEIMRVACGEPPALGLNNELDQIVRMALRKEPERRYGSAAQLGEDISRFLSHHPVSARPDSLAYRVAKFTERNRVMVAAAALAIVSLAAGAGIAVWQAGVALREARQSRQSFDQVRKLARTVLFDFDASIQNLTGATEARELLVKTALDYLDNLSGQAGSDLSLRRELAAAYEKVGDVQGEPARPNLGKRGAAIDSYRKAIGLWESIGAAADSDSAALARLYLKLHDLSGDRALLDKGVAMARRALAGRPTDEEALSLAVRAERGLGMYFNNRSDGGKALDHFRAALRISEQWNQSAPGDASGRSVASMLAYIADAALRKGDPDLTVRTAGRMQPFGQSGDPQNKPWKTLNTIQRIGMTSRPRQSGP